MTPEEEKELLVQEKLSAKIEGKKKLHDFLREKLKYINRSLLLIWCVAIVVECLDAANIINSELLKVITIGLIGGIPIAFIAEEFGIYRKWGVSVDIDEAEDLVRGKKK